MVLAGNRALTLTNKSKIKADLIHKSIFGIMLIASIIMILIGVLVFIQKINNSILYLFFGGFGTFMTIKDFKNFTKNKNAWLKSHLGRMIGALIASITSFMVAGLNIGTLIIWISPTILGTIYISF